MDNYKGNTRSVVIRMVFIVVALLLLVRLLFLQLFEEKYKIMANDIAIYKKVVYPPRGIILDRTGKVMASNETVYDLMITPSQVKKNIDTNFFCQVLNIDTAFFRKQVLNSTIKNGYRRKGVFIEQLNASQIAGFQENIYAFDGFEMMQRSIRTYPEPIAAVVLGYIGEVSKSMLEKERYASYNQGDYVGISGLEYSYEEVLRGQRGIYFFERDNFNRPRDPYKGGSLDTPEIAGKNIELYLDAELQKLGEELMANKLGSAVAIDPQTGGILAMVSSPTYDPNQLRGKERSKNFYKLSQDATKPLFNRAIIASYNPGSTQKPMTALAALDAGVITPSFGISCGGGYYNCSRRIGCTHSGGGHAANLRAALANSCNSYFLHIYRMVVDAKQYGGVREGLRHWHKYMSDFGFGHKLGVDIPYEKPGTVYNVEDYDRMYNGSWNSCTNLFVGMGQGEILQTPLQMANAMCLIANRGYYYKPHFVKSIGGNPNDSLLQPYLEKIVPTHISKEAYDIVALGMMDVVTHGTGRVAQIPGIEVCAKTGTVENKAVIYGKAVKLQNHSMFVAFAPRENPKIAIAVAVENAGYGATWAGPVASLMIEKYLTGEIADKRKYLVERLVNAKLIPHYTYVLDSQQRAKDLLIWNRKQDKLKVEDSLQRHRDSLYFVDFFSKNYKWLPPTVQQKTQATNNEQQ